MGSPAGLELHRPAGACHQPYADGHRGNGQVLGRTFAQEKKAMEELNTIAMQKKLIAAFRERKMPVTSWP
jgi:hypothetical protein